MNIEQLKNWIFSTLRESAWAPLCIVGFYVFGLALDLFDKYPWIDMPSHLAGGMALTYFYRSAIKNSQKVIGDVPHPIQILFAFTCAGTTIILWEFYEELLDFFFDALVVRSLEDTIRDMFLGLIGALVLSLFYRKR